MAKDLTKYRIKGTEKWLSKNRLVLDCVKQFFKDVYVGDNAYLQKTWPADIQGGAGIIKPLSEVQNERYYFMDDVLTSPDGIQYVVCNQWGSGNFDKFLKLANDLGYPVESNSSTSQDSSEVQKNTSPIDHMEDEEISRKADEILAVLKMRKYIEDEFTKNDFFPTFRDLIFSVPSNDRLFFMTALKELIAENEIPYLKTGIYLATNNWDTDDQDLAEFISQISTEIDDYKPSLLEYITQKKDMMFAVSNACISYDIAFETLKNIDTKLILFGLRAAGFENINEVDSDLKIGKFKHTICSVLHHIFSRLDMDEEYNSVEKLCHLLTATIDDFIEGFELDRGILFRCLGQVIWARYEINFGSYISETELFDFESKDFWGFDFEYPIDFKKLATDILKSEGFNV
ncbi:MAG: hypothetical protein ACK5H3_03370 [Flavobacteriia bacterium]|jgi:hypothetical protein